MTGFNHSQRNGRRKKAKQREKRRDSLGLKSPEALIEHRELEYLRHPSPERWRKLRAVLWMREKK